jgi:hypothetical protein
VSNPSKLLLSVILYLLVKSVGEELRFGASTSLYGRVVSTVSIHLSCTEKNFDVFWFEDVPFGGSRQGIPPFGRAVTKNS